MTRLDAAQYLGHLRAESRRFRDVLAGADPTSRVPACPEWDAADLLWHLTQVQWFWSTIVAGRPSGPPQGWPPPRPDTHAQVLATFDERSAALAAALEAADPAETAWSWAPEQTVGFTFRRQAHEALIHRLDAEQVTGQAGPLDPALAADGVAELLDVMYGGQPPPGARFEPAGGYVRVSLADVGASLWVRPGTLLGPDPTSGRSHDGPHLLVVADPGAPADATISGAAGDVDAWLWSRRGAGGIQRDGDERVLDAFIAATDAPLD